ncbi:alpha/beta hydrolase [Streptomyces sp. NPDC054950]
MAFRCRPWGTAGPRNTRTPIPVEDSCSGLQWLADHAAELGVDPAITPFLVWSNDDNDTGWGALLGERVGGDTVPVYAAPTRVADPAGLPPTYIEVGTLDLFRDEDMEYARRLNAAAVPTELHVHPGAPHAVEAIAPGAGVSMRSTADRIRILTSL